MSSTISRSRGRVTGQVVSTYRSRVLDGDVLELARIITRERGELWTVLKDDFQAFDRDPEARCGINGCTGYPYLWWREERDQWYWKCSGVLSLSDDGVVLGHSTTLRRSITKGSIFYRKKMILQYMVSAMYQFFQGVRIADVLRNHNDGQLDFDGENNQLFFRAHQVVNHSRGFTTVDQVTNNPEVSLTPVSGHLHTNIIECLWRDLKVFIGPRYRNAKDCPGKLLEYLWRYANQGGFISGMKRCIREVEVLPSNAGNDEGPVFFTAGRDGEGPEAQARRLRREEQLFDQWINRRRSRDEDEEVLSDSDGDNDDPRDQDYIPASVRISRPLPFRQTSTEEDPQEEEVSVRRSGRIPTTPRRRVGRPAGSTGGTRTAAGRGRPSRGRGRPRGSITRGNRS
ncbi:hypothetical protein INT48_004190 [Thamnidium elegans]|uniref:Uncharacterized protein n=1 Tax=Thamnidium elegans TaxID=101142 RepID=A0A8H7VTR8_9FUNG|nr:hypothetical protein INT48_004190 [Thamnidium elegans]